MALTKEGYAEFGIFKFWTSYITIFHLGFINGYNLKYGDKSFDELKTKNIPIILRKYIYTQVVIFMILFIIAIVLKASSLYYFVLFYFIIHNINSLYIKMFPGTMQFKKYAIQNVILTIIQLALVIIMFILKNDNPHTYIYILLFIEIIKALYGTFTFKTIIFRRGLQTNHDNKDYLSVLILGLPMMISVYVANFSLGLDKLFIQNNGTRTEYANYTFAYEYVMMIYGFIIIGNDIIIPYLLRYKGNRQGYLYKTFTQVINVFFIVSLVLMFLPTIYVYIFNPQYIDALKIYYVLFIVILLKLQYNAKLVPFYTYEKKGNIRLVLSLITLLIALVLNYIVLYFTSDYSFYAIATVITFYISNLMSDLYFIKKYEVNIIIDHIYQIIVISAIILVALGNLQLPMIILICIVILVLVYYLYSKPMLKLLGFKKKISHKES